MSLLKLAGYAALIKQYDLQVIPNWHMSLVANTRTHRIESDHNRLKEVFPTKYWPGETSGDHLEFALKYDGTNLAILDSLFQVIPKEDIINYIQSKPNGKYARRMRTFGLSGLILMLA